jgi:acetyl-CoA C-acetyltransferase
MVDERQPVLIGAAQWVDRESTVVDALDPLSSLERVAREACDDTGRGAAALESVDTVGIVDVAAWAPTNTPRLLAERLGIRVSSEIETGLGGEMSLALTNAIAGRIRDGECEVALLAGSNNLRSAIRARKEQIPLDWPAGGEGEPERIGPLRPGNSEQELKHGLESPIHVYPLIENALRARRGLDLESHRQSMGRLFSRFSEVASHNPYAWFPVARSADELVTATPRNRMISYPYTKYLNAVLYTDQAAAVVMTCAAKARALGIPEEKWVYWAGGAECVERAWFVSERPQLHRCPAMAECAARTLSMAGLAMDEIDFIDFYSCFPVAVEMACESYGVAEDDPRGHTVTGGLPYAGGPANNYPLHAVSSMAEKIRATPGSKGITTGNGWYLTKHSACVWSSEPPATAHADGKERIREAEAASQAALALPVAEEATGSSRVDSYTVVFDRDGAPSQGIVVGRLDDGPRFVANTPTDRTLLEDLVSRELVGSPGRVSHVDGLNRFTPG